MTRRWRRLLRAPLILFGINLVIGILAAGVIYGYAGNQIWLRDRLASGLHNLNAERTTEAEDLAYLRANQTSYERLLERGLLAGQDRLAAARLLEQLRSQHRVNSIHYSFSPQRAAPLGPGRLARMTLLSTDVTIEMTGVTDLDLLAFARGVANELPGDVRVIAFSLERRSEVAPDLLARLRAGAPVDLVGGRLQLEWRALRWQDDGVQPPGSS
jgi:hypothetical protein